MEPPQIKAVGSSHIDFKHAISDLSGEEFSKSDSINEPYRKDFLSMIVAYRDGDSSQIYSIESLLNEGSRKSWKEFVTNTALIQIIFEKMQDSTISSDELSTCMRILARCLTKMHPIELNSFSSNVAEVLASYLQTDLGIYSLISSSKLISMHQQIYSMFTASGFWGALLNLLKSRPGGQICLAASKTIVASVLFVDSTDEFSLVLLLVSEILCRFNETEEENHFIESAIENSICCLSFLTKTKSSFASAIIHSEIVGVILQVLHSSLSNSSALCADLFSLMIEADTDPSMVFLISINIPKHISQLLAESKEVVLQKACKLLTKLAAATKGSLDSIITKEILDQLFINESSSSYEGKDSAIRTICELIGCQNELSINNYLFEKDGIRPIFEYALSADNDLQYSTLIAINKLMSKYPEKMGQMLNEGLDDVLNQLSHEDDNPVAHEGDQTLRATVGDLASSIMYQLQERRSGHGFSEFGEE